MEATLTLHQAGDRLGIGDGALNRLIEMGALPEARREQGVDGETWVIPAAKLPTIAIRNGWTIDLRNGAKPLAAPAGHGTDLVPHRGGPPTPRSDPTPERTRTGPPSMGEVLDLELLDRLLGAQEGRVVAQAEARESKNALAALNEVHNRTTGELEVERRERMVAADRYREERMARAVADAKVAELRDRVVREMALADAEKQARAEALTRSIRAERDAANAHAVMGWLARRRYRRLSAGGDLASPAD